MANIVYQSATDHINKHTYAVTVPPYVSGVHKQVLNGELFTPVYEAFDPFLFQRSRISISNMVSFNISKTPFTIIDDHDVLEILHQIDAYVEEVYELRHNKEISIYIEKILKLRPHIYKHFRRILNKHPQWYQAYDQGEGLFGTLQKLYKPLGIEVDLPKPLLEELAYPCQAG